VLALVAGCKAPSINLTTGEPIKVDIAMRLDVYQHTDSEGQPSKPATPARGANAAERRKNREADIQTFKNSRLVGEGHDGLLVVLAETAGENGDYVREYVAAENADRMAQMKARSEKEKRSLAEIQKEQAELWANRSFKGEWIEVQGANGAWGWQQKKG